MAIAFDATGVVNTAGTTATLSHTCTGSDRIVFADVLDGSYNPSEDTITGCTYNGVAMTKLGQIGYTDNDNVYICYLYYLVNPPTGAKNVVASRTSSKSEIRLRVSSYTGVKQVAPSNSLFKNNASGSITITLSSTNANSWALFSTTSQGYTGFGTGGTSRQGSFGDSGAIIDDTSYTKTWSGTGKNGVYMVEMEEATATNTTDFFQLF